VNWVRFDDSRCPLVLVSNGGALCEIRFGSEVPTHAAEAPEDPVLCETARQLRLYFDGELRGFELLLEPQGTSFQQRVWQALLRVPYGETRSYGQIAEEVGAAKAVRAVGAANGSNPIPIVIPCHRVIGANRKLTGFGGGLPLKRFLLDLELSQALPDCR